MPYKNAKQTLTKEQFAKLTSPEMAALVGPNVSVERAKAFLTQLISDGKIVIEDPQALYNLTFGRVVVEGAISAAGVSTTGVKAPKAEKKAA